MPLDPVTGKQLSTRDHAFFESIRSLINGLGEETSGALQLQSDLNPENHRLISEALSDPNLHSVAKRVLQAEQSKMHDAVRTTWEGLAPKYIEDVPMYKLPNDEKEAALAKEGTLDEGRFRGIRGVPARWRPSVGTGGAVTDFERTYPRNWYEALRNFVEGNVPQEGDSEELRNRKIMGLTSFGGILAGAKGAGRVGGETLQRFQSGLRDAYRKSGQALWRETRTEPGFEGKLRWEIDDTGAKLRSPENLRSDQYTQGVVGDFLQHPELFKAYPELAGAPMQVKRQLPGLSREGSFNPGRFDFSVAGRTDVDLITAILHELQHGVQKQETFARGTNPVNAIFSPGLIKGEPQELIQKMKQLGFDSPAMRTYARHAGEVEARNVEWRFANPVERQFAPSLTEDVFRKWQLEGLQLKGY